jgi:hypothetical protein
MKFTVILTLILSSIGLIAHAQCPAATASVTTYYATNNGQRGCMFNITASQDITVICFDANLYAGTTADYEIYYRPGTYVGSENNAAAWNLVGTTTALTSAGSNVPTNIPIPVNVFIPAGQTYGFYVTNTFGGGTSYTDGTGANVLLGSDASISINGGVGKSYPFGLTFSFREFNGAVHYTPGTPLDVSLTSFEAKVNNRDVLLSWETASEQQNDYFTLERSLDAENWEQIAQIKGAGTTVETTKYHFTDENVPGKMAYYRLSQTDFDGSKSDYTVRAVKLETDMPENKLIVGPNPTADFAHILASPDEIGDVFITTLTGQTVPVTSTVTNSGVVLDLRELQRGIYVVRMNSFSALLKKID